MNRDELLAFHGAVTAKMHEICKAKNQDYTGGADREDCFANFTRVEALGIATTEQGFLTRMVDKLMRINALTKTGQQAVKDEAVEDTLLDLANYAILFAAYLKSKTIDVKAKAGPEDFDPRRYDHVCVEEGVVLHVAGASFRVLNAALSEGGHPVLTVDPIKKEGVPA